MNDQFICPHCKKSSFQMAVLTHDQVDYEIFISADGKDIELGDYLGKEYCGDTEYIDEFECMNCGQTFSRSELWPEKKS